MSEANIVLSAVDNTKGAFDSVKGGLQGLHTNATSVVGALGALGVAGSALAFAGTIKSAIDAADAINKLSQRTGIATEQLSQLQFAAKLSDVSAESLTGAMKKLNLSIAEAAGGDSKKAEIFKNLGVSLKDAEGNARSADKVLLDIATTMSTAKDGANKTAYAVGLMGKAGDEMIPLLNGGGQAIEEMMHKADRLGLTIGTDFAKQAESFNDNLTIMHASASRLAISLASELVEGLGRTAKAMADVSVEGGKMAAIVAGIQTLFTGDDRHKANVAMVDTYDQIAASESALAKAQASGDTARITRLSQRIAGLKEEYETHQKYAASLDKQSEKDKAAEPKKADVLKSLTGATGSVAAETAYEKLNKELEKKIALEKAEFDFGGKLSESRKFQAEILAKITGEGAKLTAGQQAQLKSTLALASAAQELNNLRDAEYKQALEIATQRQALRSTEYEQGKQLVVQAIEAANARNKAASEMLENIEFETAALSMNAQQRETATALRELERQGIVQGTEAWDQYGQAISKALGNKAALSQDIDRFNTLFTSVDAVAKSVFTSVEQEGIGTFKRIGKTLKASLLDMLYQMTVKKWAFDITASVSGASGGAVSAVAQSALGGTGNMASLASSALSASGIGASISSTIGSLSGSITGLTASNIALAPTIGISVAEATAGAIAAGAAGGASTLVAGLAAIGPAGWVAIAAVAAFAIFGGDKKSASQSTGSMERTYDAEGKITSSISPFAVGNGAEVVDSLFKQFKTLQTALGGTGGASLGYGAYSGTGDENPMFQITGGSFNSGETGLSDAALQLAADRAILSSLQNSTLPKGIAQILNTLDPATASSEQIKALEQSAIAYSSGIKTISEALNLMPFSTLKNMAFDTADALAQASGGIQALTGNLSSYFENFYSAEEQRAQKVSEIARTLNKAGVQVTEEQIGGMTDKQYRALVDAQGAATEANAPMLAALYATSAAFFSVTKSSLDAAKAEADTAAALTKATQIAQERLGLESQLLQLQGDTTELRNRELAAIDPANHALKQMIYTLEDAAKALAQAKANGDAALQTLGNSINTAKNGSKSALDAQIAIITAQKSAAAQAFESQKVAVTASMQASQSTASRLANLSSSLQSSMDGMQVVGTEKLDRITAQQQINAALTTARNGGGLPDADKLKQALAAVGKPSEQMFSTFTDYQRDLMLTKNSLTELNDITQTQQSAAEQTVTLLQSMLDSGQSQYDELIKSYDKAAFAAQDKYDKEIAQFDASFKLAQDQLAEALGTTVAVLSVGEAVKSVEAAIRAIKLSNNPIRGFDLIPTGAEAGDSALGNNSKPFIYPPLTEPPFIGPLVNQPDQRLVSATDSEMLPLLEELVAEIKNARIEGRATALSTRKMADLLQSVTQDGLAMQTAVAA